MRYRFIVAVAAVRVLAGCSDEPIDRNRSHKWPAANA